MNIINGNQPFELRPMSFMIYGDPDIGKTSLGLTSTNCILIDANAGGHRAVKRADITLREDWSGYKKGILSKEFHALFANGFRAVVMDTPQDFLLNIIGGYLKMTNAGKYNDNRKWYGDIKDEFRWFRQSLFDIGFDIVYISHQAPADKKEGSDFVQYVPKIVGSTYDVIMSETDVMAYMQWKDNGRKLCFQKNASYFTKNMLNSPDLDIPDWNDPSYSDFFFKHVIKPAKERVMKRSLKQVDIQTESTPKEATPATKTNRVKKESESGVATIPPATTPIDPQVLVQVWNTKFNAISEKDGFNRLVNLIRDSETLSPTDKKLIHGYVIKPQAKRLSLHQIETGLPFVSMEKNNRPEKTPSLYSPEDLETAKKIIDAFKEWETYELSDIPDMEFSSLEIMAKVETFKAGIQIQSITAEIFRSRISPAIRHLLATENRATNA